MRTIDAAILAQLQAKTLRPFVLLDFDLDGTNYRYTDCDVPIVSTYRYSPRSIKMEAVKYSLGKVVDSVKLEVSNLDSALTDAFVDGTPQGGEVLIKLILLNDSYTAVASPQIFFQGNIDGWSLDEEKLTVTIASEFVRWNQRTLEKHSASCRWKQFKGTECAYAGAETWCDRSYTRCVTLGNSANFGGFRWLPSIIDKEIWWGYSPPMKKVTFIGWVRA